ncbi:proprotein convertase P-domain-containing protein [Stieleria sp. JC731]|uniref:proprotein convertase P-domain-containing protein n=1 Tax=Pirellulaceae TaxID=2691357 RepID=UPI001E5A58F8|nr:proprotein convertase P-domain-containing protein [Stieleria sp. JC731]MCC9599579.1 proprotein convertase P-domain-containing protein [Stieleria sp. JC731]
MFDQRIRQIAITCFATLVFSCITGRPVQGQAGLRESLEQLDRDNDGMIEPHEITPLARPYLERVAESRRMSLQRPNRIDQWQEAARIYYAMKNGSDRDSIRPSREKTLKDFRPGDDDIMVPEFGIPIVKYPYTADDLDEAEDQIRRYDRNRDGYLDRREASRGRWTNLDPFTMDFDKDDRLSRLELAQRYARRRSVRDDSDQLIQRARRVGNGIESSGNGDDQRSAERDRRDWYRRGGSRYWLTASVIERFDANRNGRLEQSETIQLGIPFGALDANSDGELSREELFAYLSELQDQTGGLVEGLPGWFYELDTNRDGQVDLPEFATELTDERVAEFVGLDANGDGLLSTNEILSSKDMTGGVFENTEAEMLPPRKTIVSEIEIDETFVIADLNLQLAITHTQDDSLDAYLTGPDGTRIELFTGVGGRDDHFEDTIFDDQASTPINKARAPFQGSFIPEGLIKRGPGLGVFNGKPITGIWQLTIRCSRSERFGMLHRWALMARPDEEKLIGQTPSQEPEIEAESTSDPSLSNSPVDQPSAVGLDSWTAEQKAQITASLRKPASEEWSQMSEEEKRQYNERRKLAIKEYKQALGKTPR